MVRGTEYLFDRGTVAVAVGSARHPAGRVSLENYRATGKDKIQVCSIPISAINGRVVFVFFEHGVLTSNKYVAIFILVQDSNPPNKVLFD